MGYRVFLASSDYDMRSNVAALIAESIAGYRARSTAPAISELNGQSIQRRTSQHTVRVWNSPRKQCCYYTNRWC